LRCIPAGASLLSSLSPLNANSVAEALPISAWLPAVPNSLQGIHKGRGCFAPLLIADSYADTMPANAHSWLFAMSAITICMAQRD
jgi:hypothetical protein